VLAQAGTSKSKVLTASIWLKNIATDFQPMNTAWNDWIDPLNKPVRVTVEAPMSSEQMLVEIQVTATTDKQ
jgi:enamine deaminase RidA (YjgF/YER057c/UK114 family)